MNDPLQDAVNALRETTSGEHTGAARYTRARVLAKVRVQKRRRVVSLTFGLPLAALLIGSAAWAASSGSLSGLVRRVSTVLGLQTSFKQAAIVGHPAPSGRRAEEPTRPESSFATAPLAPPAATNVDSVKELTAVGTTRMAKPQSSNARSAPRDNEVTERELSLYETAHRAHFVNHDDSAALAGWDEYLKGVPRGRFALEAKYNRALCLLRLGRISEARVALAPFATDALGGYRKTEARALLEQLEQRPPKP